MNQTTLNQTVYFDATPGEVYTAYLDPAVQSKATGAEATGGTQVGDEFTAWDGYIFGKTVELEPNKRIVQEWQTTEWPEGYPPSRFEITLEPDGDGTKLTMVHSLVPAEQADDYAQGWEDYYWEPLKRYFANK